MRQKKEHEFVVQLSSANGVLIPLQRRQLEVFAMGIYYQMRRRHSSRKLLRFKLIGSVLIKFSFYME